MFWWRKDRKMDSARTVCNVMQRHGCLPDTVTYNVLIKGYCTIGNTDKSMSMLINMFEGRATATLLTHNTIIKGYCDSGNTAADDDEWSYTQLIFGFCKMGEMESAYQMFNEMRDHGFCPNEVTYTAPISGYCKDEKLECATRMFEHMKISGCRPTVQTCNVLIHGLTKHNIFSAVQELLMMLEENISPNVVTYTTIIDGLCKNGAASLALEMFNRMVEHNCSPNLHIYSSLIQALGQEGKVEEAEELFTEL
ncbi:hypothetical protein CFC21_051232 [Triticum aestivum]|uniref:Pentacotripeptide-repeat region of PRORP domain-containing protein n=2 Tax=Triticum aestivum TaxID=4565 RepID=A0A9R1K5E3_WHEAT|nr:hypothetical protein CFC21_051232 [Triticum aestivum]